MYIILPIQSFLREKKIYFLRAESYYWSRNCLADDLLNECQSTIVHKSRRPN